jgi:DNA-binding XRE family transcriptional regulator
MAKTINSAVIGSLVRQARLAAALSQTQLGHRIGASRFWVAQFEKGKPSAELGLALKAMQAVGLAVQIEPKIDSKSARRRERSPQGRASRTVAPSDLAKVIAQTR